MKDLIRRFFKATPRGLDIEGDKVKQRFNRIRPMLPAVLRDSVEELNEMWNPDVIAERLGEKFQEVLTREEFEQVVLFLESNAGQKYLNSHSVLNAIIVSQVDNYLRDLVSAAVQRATGKGWN